MTPEQRHSYRCESIDERQKAVIKVNGRDLVVQLMNQSAGGFSVSTSNKLRVREGKTVRVRTSAGWFEAQVVHKQVVDGNTVLGLVRIGDLADPRDAQLVKPGGRRFEVTGGGGTTPGAFLMLMIVAALAFWCAMWFQGIGGTAIRRVDLGAFVSRVIDTVKPAATAAKALPKVSQSAAANAE